MGCFLSPNTGVDMRTLHELPRFRDRWSYLYLEMGRLDVDADSLAFHQGERMIPLPIDQLAVVMLGPGSTVTHAAVKSLSRNNCLLAWTGQDGIRLYAASIGGTYSARRMIRQAHLVSSESDRLRIAWRMYRFRFDEQIPQEVTLQQIRGMEGLRVRRAYAEVASKYGIDWKGRRYKQDNWDDADPINRALSSANACLYGICHAAILSAGYSPSLGFIHTGKMLSFVYDIADLYKTDITIPVAFSVTAEKPTELERAVRMECRKAFYKFKIMERILPDIAEVLDAGNDLRESPEEFEGRIITLDAGAEDWSIPGESERASTGRTLGKIN